jgi:aminoglycoside phosphotransferase (APT) family kinase protein
MTLKTGREVDIDEAQLYALVRATLPEIRAGSWVPESFSIERTSKHHDKKLAYCHLAYADRAAGTLAEAELVVKYYGNKSGASSTRAALQYLRGAGFDADQRYCVPRFCAYAPEQRALVQTRAEGITWAEWLRQAPEIGEQVTTDAADWLVRLQQTPIPARIPAQCLSETPYRCLVAPDELLEALATSFPAYASRLRWIKEQLRQRLSAVDGLPSVLSHGDFHPKNILFTPRQTTVIDFDAYGAHEAAFDVGYCIGQLFSMAYAHYGTVAPGAVAANSFWRRYAREGSAEWRHVSLVTTCTLIQVLHYTRRALRGARAQMLTLWLDLIEQWLMCDDERILPACSRLAPGLACGEGL